MQKVSRGRADVNVPLDVQSLLESDTMENEVEDHLLVDFCKTIKSFKQIPEMVSTVQGPGRFANQVIRNFAMHFLVKKFDIKAT
jgi:hypothetical protein